MTTAAQLSSLQTSLAELAAKVTTAAEGFSGSERDDLASSLFEVERALHTAGRRLERIVEALR